MDTRRRNARARSPKAIAPAPLRPEDDEAVVRMYGQGLGDCFLIALPRSGYGDNARPVWIVIDCGIIPGTPGGPERIRGVVRDLRASTIWPDDQPDADDGSPRGHIDLLILTHEHMDHVSSFLDSEAAEEWARITVERVWTAWTEKPGGGLPDKLKRLRATQRQALVAAAARARRFGLADTESTMLDLLSFEGSVRSDNGLFQFSERADQAMKRGIACCPEEAVAYCEPGEARPVPGTRAVAYILGPPRDQRYLGKPDPTPSRPETYEPAPVAGADGDGEEPPVRASNAFGASLEWSLDGPSPINAFAMPLLLGEEAARFGVDAGADMIDAGDDCASPFDPYLRIPIPSAEAGAADYAGLSSYFDDAYHWRRIDFEWLESSDEFAVQLGDLTNNSSLVVAFELPRTEGRDRKVLLFVGDAMVGNWLSWDAITEWKVVDNAPVGSRAANIDDLLRRVVFYKVGHHGSHNATLKAKGLERMSEGGDLTAFVPVSPVVARKLKRWCEMPLDTLMDALVERADGRVVLGNGRLWPAAQARGGNRAGADDTARLKDLGVELAGELLPKMTRERDGATELIEPANPLWVQVRIPY